MATQRGDEDWFDFEKVMRLYSTNAAFAAIIDLYKSRKRNIRTSNVTGLVNALRRFKRPHRRSMVIAALKDLQAAECGTFTLGRKGHESRFDWSVKVAAVVKRALGPTSSESLFAEWADGDDLLLEELDEFLMHEFVLRPGVKATVALPADLTRAEAERFAGFIRTLPFEGPP